MQLIILLSSFDVSQKIKIHIPAATQTKNAQKEIKELRKRRLSEGLTFMINAGSLPQGQCYLEFPDGSMVIAEANSKESDFNIIEELDGFEINKIKKELNLI